MAEENPQRQNRAISATTQSGKPFMGRHEKAILAGIIGWLNALAIELFGAIKDHRNWIRSDRARVLATTFDVSGRLLTYAAYIAIAWLAFKSFVGIRSGLSQGIYAVPEHFDGSRVALFNILAAGLLGPMAIITIGIGIGWMYNLTTAVAHRTLPRFAYPWIHPSIMFVVVAAFAAFHSTVTVTVARGYLYAKANIEAASPMDDASVIEIPGRDATSAREASGERELARLRSLFNRGRPCLNGAQGTEFNPQSEVTRPEPGPAASLDCQVEKTTPRE